MKKLFSTEQISKYHPDKYADQISDAVLTAALNKDPHARVACETLVKDNTVVLAGEITTTAELDYEAIVRKVAKKLGYQVDKVINLLGIQSRQIGAAVDKNGAGDQGMMFGYATKETESRLPLGFHVANGVIKRLEHDIEYNEQSPLKGDAKTQVTIDLETGEVETLLVSACHHEWASLEQLRTHLKRLLPEFKDKLLINPAGRWTIGGPTADSGLTGRKIVCDQYGGYKPVGGGAFSGKDPSKVDRSGAYMARQLALDIIEGNSEIKWAEVQLAYAIGVAEPVSIYVKTDQPERDEQLQQWVKNYYDLTPSGMIHHLNLLNLDYEKLAEGCHFYYNKIKAK
jgi:S-adenosylmethionine synthetase